MNLSPRALSTGIRVSESELAWRPEDLPSVIDELIASVQAILGGEVLLLSGGEIWGTVPQPSGPPGVYAWEVKPRSSGESWQEFVSRSALEASQAAKRFSTEIRELPSLPPDSEAVFCLTWAREEEHQAV